MKNASTLPIVMRFLFLLACSVATVLLYVIVMIPLIWIMTPLGFSEGAIDNTATVTVALLYTVPLYMLYFSDGRMDPAKRFFLANSADGWKPIDMLKRYFAEFGALDGIIAAIPTAAVFIGILSGFGSAGIILIPVGAFQPQAGMMLPGLLLGLALFCAEYILCLLLRFRKWDKERLHR